jgi:hypothetical protein
VAPCWSTVGGFGARPSDTLTRNSLAFSSATHGDAADARDLLFGATRERPSEDYLLLALRPLGVGSVGRDINRDAKLRQLIREADGGARRHHKHGSLLDSGAPRPSRDRSGPSPARRHPHRRQALLIVDTNEQVARLSGQLHADLGRLGRIDDQASVEPLWSEVGSFRVAVGP